MHQGNVSLHRKALELEATPIMGERRLWDDFHVVGNPHSPEWANIYAKILGAYKWGTAKKENYRHAGTDLKTQV